MRIIAQYLSFIDLGGTETNIDSLLKNIDEFDFDVVTSHGTPIPFDWCQKDKIHKFKPDYISPHENTYDLPQIFKAVIYSPHTLLTILINFYQKCGLQSNTFDLVHFQAIDMQQFDWTGISMIKL
jgi:hypothetical protein